MHKLVCILDLFRRRAARASWLTLLFAIEAALAAEAAPFAYVTNAVAGTVSVIDVANNAVVATVPVGAYPAWVAVTPF